MEPAPAPEVPADDSDGDPARRRRTRDRHDRGMRGPAVAPGAGRPHGSTRRERFDELALQVIAEVDRRWSSRLGLVEYAVEDTPHLPDSWSEPTVPLATVVRGAGRTPTRLVLFRRPIEHRVESREDLERLLIAVVVEQVADLLGLEPEDVDPRYRSAEEE